ncbi:MAG: nitroreductase family protein [Desulfomonilia bacterium]
MEFRKTMIERRAVNVFDPKKSVSEKELKLLVETAALAPSSFNLQPWQIIVVKSPENKERLKAAAWNQPKITEAPVVLIVLADRDGWKTDHPVMEKVWNNMVDLGYFKSDQRVWFEGGTNFLYHSGNKSLAFAIKNASFFGLALMLAAKDIGLDTHPMDGFDHVGVRKAFNIPDNLFIVMLIALGHFNKQYKLMPPKWRKTYKDIVLKKY